ncbi:MAG: o-succinylbenzoate synthase [bacterium]
MRIISVETYRYDLPLVRPLSLKRGMMEIRSGMVIRLRDERGYEGLGEVAPFPGLHRENLKQVKRQLSDCMPCLLDTTIPEGIAGLNGGFEAWLGDLGLFPCVRFGVELAVLNLLGDEEKLPLHALLSPVSHREVLINGLIADSGNDIEAQAKAMAAEGYRCIKLKVGHLPVDSAVTAVQRVRAAVPAQVSLRVDANRAWTLPHAVSFGSGIAGCGIDYVEEPLRDPGDLETFHEKTGIPIALDETLAGMPPNDAVLFKGVGAWVLKPSVLGGFENAAQFCRLAMKNGVVPVVSCAFQSGIALSGLAQFAAAFTPPDAAMGLDTYRWLAEDLLVTPFRARRGAVDVAAIAETGRAIRHDLLQEIEGVYSL